MLRTVTLLAVEVNWVIMAMVTVPSWAKADMLPDSINPTQTVVSIVDTRWHLNNTVSTERAPEEANYFPPPESRGGWRKLDTPDEIRQIAGVDPNRLSELKDLVITRQTGSSGSWKFEEYLRRACAVIIEKKSLSAKQF
ncbi:MAG: hypothetical protein J7K65_00240 [Planctomycetes bacterium]|nr:hypothetical protein [Planctomycetota bacterium]